METRTVNIYEFDELRKSVQEHLVNQMRTDVPYFNTCLEKHVTMGRKYLISLGFVVEEVGPTFFTTVMQGDQLLPLLRMGVRMTRSDQEALIHAGLNKFKLRVTCVTNPDKPLEVKVTFRDWDHSNPISALLAFEHGVRDTVYQAAATLEARWNKTFAVCMSNRALRRVLRDKGCVFLVDGTVFMGAQHAST